MAEESSGRSWAGLSRRYGSSGGWGAWKSVSDQYYEDRLEDAFEAALSLGSYPNGQNHLYRMIEAESLARKDSQIVSLNNHVRMETPERWSDEDVKSVGHHVLEAIGEVQSRMGVLEAFPVLVSFLPEEVNAPWTPGRFGYMVDKVPFDKICLPTNLRGNRTELGSATRHEFAHVVNLNLSNGEVPHWLDEGIAMVMGDSRDSGFVHRIKSGELDWLGPEVLSDRFEGDRSSQAGLTSVRWAYGQSAELGYALVEMGGETKLADLMRGFANNSTWQELKMRVTGQGHDDEALREVYGVGVKEFFESVRVKITSSGL